MAKTIIIKIGSSTLTTTHGTLDHANLHRIVAEAARLVKARHKVVIVTSGAIVTGAQALGLKAKPQSIPQKQAAAAIGQSRLMRQYEKAFEEHGITVAQVLLTRDALADRRRHQNARNCLHTLLDEKVVPIINENDTVAVDEIRIGDNDTLAALTARLVGADLLIILSDVDGFFMKDKQGVPFLVPEVKKIDRAIKKAAGQAVSDQGTGGMLTKIQAAQICSRAGITMAIAGGRKPGVITAIAGGKKFGTLFRPKA
ncbi:MAG: glutamate 5-kinase [Candidatus Margulisbacteria bacterium]|jgi:glutamate 5-kinase|nr:glutamate 5-kinase [Candidatus Margulisiibacteriota bacterium]